VLRSLFAAKLLEYSFERNGLPVLTLSDRFEEHLLGVGVGFERFIPFREEHRHGSAFRKFGVVQLDSTVYDSARSNSHVLRVYDIRREPGAD